MSGRYQRKVFRYWRKYLPSGRSSERDLDPSQLHELDPPVETEAAFQRLLDKWNANLPNIWQYGKASDTSQCPICSETDCPTCSYGNCDNRNGREQYHCGCGHSWDVRGKQSRKGDNESVAVPSCGHVECTGFGVCKHTYTGV